MSSGTEPGQRTAVNSSILERIGTFDVAVAMSLLVVRKSSNYKTKKEPTSPHLSETSCSGSGRRDRQYGTPFSLEGMYIMSYWYPESVKAQRSKRLATTQGIPCFDSKTVSPVNVEAKLLHAKNQSESLLFQLTEVPFIGCQCPRCVCDRTHGSTFVYV